MDKDAYNLVAAVEARHWYFVARRHIIQALMKAYFPAGSARRILDLGAGTGGTLELLRPYGQLTGIEYAPEALHYCRQRVAAYAALVRGSGTALPVRPTCYDLVTAFDVLEHIPDDAATASEIWRILKPGGAFFCIVPAHPWLWSDFDELSHHQRRYTMDSLATLLQHAGLQIEDLFYTNSWIFGPVVVLRGLRKMLKRVWQRSWDAGGELRVPSQPLNSLLTHLFSSEARFLPRYRLPFGVSLVVIARKPSPNQPGSIRSTYQ